VFKRGVSPSFVKLIPLPLVKGKGIKGIGFINNLKTPIVFAFTSGYNW
jgi:hypothetical protein